MTALIVFQQKYSWSICIFVCFTCFGNRSSRHRCSFKKMFLKIFQISQGNIYITKILKLGRDPGLFFRVHPAGRKKHFFIILRWKKALILIYNKLVTKKNFFRNEHQSNFLSCTFLVELHVFRSGHGKPKYF